MRWRSLLRGLFDVREVLKNGIAYGRIGFVQIADVAPVAARDQPEARRFVHCNQRVVIYLLRLALMHLLSINSLCRFKYCA